MQLLVQFAHVGVKRLVGAHAREQHPLGLLASFVVQRQFWVLELLRHLREACSVLLFLTRGQWQGVGII